jgi:small subunit ribosomal protein S16
MVTIRLSRGGAKKKPFYHIDVKDSGGEQRLVLDLDRVTHWKSEGAQTSDRVSSLIKQAAKAAV